jgi:hypothetical protein
MLCEEGCWSTTKQGDDVWQHPQFFRGSTTFVNIKSRRNGRSRSRVAAEPRSPLPRQATKRRLSECGSLSVREYEAKRRKENYALGQWQADVDAQLEELKAGFDRANVVNAASFTTLSDGVKHNRTKVCAHTCNSLSHMR